MNQEPLKPWDLGRFAQTLTYFGAIPFLSQWDWFQTWFGSRPSIESTMIVQQLTSQSPQQQGSVLVVGGQGDVGSLLVQRMVARGYRVRSLLPKDVPLSQGSEDALYADLTDGITLAKVLTFPLDGVILCIDDLGEEEQREGIPQLLSLAAPFLHQAHTVPLYDFQTQGQRGDLAEQWGALDDVVMGGVSASQLQFQAGAAVFGGNVSTANSGGFASARTRNLEPPLDLSSFDGLLLKIKGDGQRYKFMVRDGDGWDSTAHTASFDTVDQTWIYRRLPFAKLQPIFRAKTVRDSAPLNRSRVTSLQVMLSKFEYDGALNPHFRPGNFRLEIASIQAYRQSPKPQVLVVTSNSRAWGHLVSQIQAQELSHAITSVHDDPGNILAE